MPKFLDCHRLKGVDEKTLKKLQDAPRDEYGVKHLNLFYNKAEDKLFCLLDAPDREAVEKHHGKAGITCDWITEVKTTV